MSKLRYYKDGAGITLRSVNSELSIPEASTSDSVTYQCKGKMDSADFPSEITSSEVPIFVQGKGLL